MWSCSTKTPMARWSSTSRNVCATCRGPSRLASGPVCKPVEAHTPEFLKRIMWGGFPPAQRPAGWTGPQFAFLFLGAGVYCQPFKLILLGGWYHAHLVGCPHGFRCQRGLHGE